MSIVSAFRAHRREVSGSRQAIWNDEVIARSPTTTTVDGYEYFPTDTVSWERLERSERTSVCPWKGVATYYDVVVGDRRLEGAAWVYENPKPAADHIRGQVAFWQGVAVEAVPVPE
jgi:uncharacterized protein (DUF427 family)